jgi:acyl-CoA thioesterase-1
MLMLGALVFGTACEREESPPAPSAGPAATAPAQPPERSDRPRVVFLGDSLTAGYGLDVSHAFPAIIVGELESQDLPIDLVNAGVSGDTTAGGLRRIDWILKQSPDVVVVGLGANDGLRGISPQASEQNLRSIIAKILSAGADVLLLGMQLPPNYGPEHTQAFREMYPRIARELNVPLVPFLLEGVGGDPSLNLSDGIHPNAEGHRVVARTVLPHLRTILQNRRQAKPAP